MSSAIGLWLGEAPWTELLSLFINVTLKGAVICAITGVATLLLHRSSAFVRNMVWVFALVGLILLPVFSVLTPLWNVPLIPELASWGVESNIPELGKPDQDAFVGPPYDARVDTPEAAGRLSNTPPIGVPWYAWGLLAWIAGCVLHLCWYLISHVGVRFIVRQAYPADNEWTILLGRVAKELDIRRRVRLLESDRLKAAITIGILNPVIVLPSDSNHWPVNRKRLVLSHELAHVKRWDTLTETFALFATVVYWFNPLVWFAVKQLRIERETDCDNAVLRAGAKPSDYAELLMNIAADLGASPKPMWQLSTISQNSNLKDRLMNILNQKINRNRGSRKLAILTGVLVLALVLPISVAGIWSSPTIQTEEKAQKEDQIKKEKQAQKDEMKKKAHKKQLSIKEKTAQMWEKICADDKSAACKVGTVIKKKGVETGVEAFYEMKKADAGEYYFDEKEFNTLGYMFLSHNKVDAAIAVFEINVKEYPESWNVYDSLGEAYMVAKRYDESIKSYETALEINPESENSKMQLKKLQMLVSKNI